jgi:hypothetical protein
MGYSPALLGLSDRHAIRCERCRIYAVEGDHRPRFYREDREDVVRALAGRAEELDRCAVLNESVWSCVTARGDDERWASYRGFGLDRGDEP